MTYDDAVAKATEVLDRIDQGQSIVDQAERELEALDQVFLKAGLDVTAVITEAYHRA